MQVNGQPIGSGGGTAIAVFGIRGELCQGMLKTYLPLDTQPLPLPLILLQSRFITLASSIFDNPGATYCNISCNGVQSGVQSIGFLWYTYTFTGLQPSTSYLVTVDVLYAAGYGGNYGFDTKTVTTLAGSGYCTVTFRHYKGNTPFNDDGLSQQHDYYHSKLQAINQ